MAVATTILVLQNEYYVAYREQNVKLKTSAPGTCNVFTLHNKESCASVMAHTDDFTSIVVTFRQINENLKKHKMDLSSGLFTAKIMGGWDQEKYSLKQKNLLIETLKSYEIHYEQVELPSDHSNRPQIVLEPHYGELTFLCDTQGDGRLQYLQESEWEKFCDFLDAKYPNLKGSEYPDFESTEATRKESDLPKVIIEALSVDSQVKILQRFEAEKKIQMPPLKPERKAVLLKEPVIRNLKEKIQGIKDVEDCQQAIDAGNFNLFLRQLAATPSIYTTAFTFLFDNRHILDIDIYSRDKTSGNALDVAEKRKNAKAIEFLKPWY